MLKTVSCICYFTIMSEVIRILSEIESGDVDAADQLLPLVYDELRKLAASKLLRREAGANVAGYRSGARGVSEAGRC